MSHVTVINAKTKEVLVREMTEQELLDAAPPAQEVVDEYVRRQAVVEAMEPSENWYIAFRTLEEVLDHLVNGEDLSDRAKAWLADRKTRRASV